MCIRYLLGLRAAFYQSITMETTNQNPVQDTVFWEKTTTLLHMSLHADLSYLNMPPDGVIRKAWLRLGDHHILASEDVLRPCMVSGVSGTTDVVNVRRMMSDILLMGALLTLDPSLGDVVYSIGMMAWSIKGIRTFQRCLEDIMNVHTKVHDHGPGPEGFDFSPVCATWCSVLERAVIQGRQNDLACAVECGLPHVLEQVTACIDDEQLGAYSLL